MEYWIIAGFGFLFSMRTLRQKKDEKRTGLSLHGVWRGSLDLLVSVLFLVTLYDLGANCDRIAFWFGETGLLALWIAAYWLGKYQKKPDLFFISLAVLACGVASTHQDWGVQVSLAMVIVSGVFIFQAVFQGLKYALRFTRVPEPVKGWPAFCLLAFCVAVALGGAARLIF